jgi:molybdenum cofactor biosynthesis enzyme MoaA
MSESVHYVTNQQGEKVGVLLDLETYYRLTNPSPSDTELLADLSLDELQALAESILASKAQVQLDELLTRNAENQISADEIVTLDCLLAQVDQLNIIKTRARYTLSRLEGRSKGEHVNFVADTHQGCRYTNKACLRRL